MADYMSKIVNTSANENSLVGGMDVNFMFVSIDTFVILRKKKR